MDGSFSAMALIDSPTHLDVYTYSMNAKPQRSESAIALFPLPCACQNLRRLTRIVTRVYDQELREADMEITQFGLLTALATMGEANQKRLSAGFAMDSTTLTRTLSLLLRQDWVQVKRGTDKRQRLFSLTAAGGRQLAEAQAYWESAEQRLRRKLGNGGWNRMKETVSQVTEAASEA
jgi:DNA-binding MarR family transcriptional regulator